MSVHFLSSSFVQTSSFYVGSGSLSSSLQSGSYNIVVSKILGSLDADFSTDTISFTIASSSAGGSNNITALTISGSNDEPLIGIGTLNPLTSIDVRSTTSSLPANIILRTNEDGTITTGEETGRIIFAIESASYNFSNGFSFTNSGSTAAIYSKVLGTSPGFAAYGSLVFEVNDSLNSTDPIEALQIGYGVDPTFSGVGLVASGNLAITSTSPVIRVKNTTSGNELARIGFHSPTDYDDGQLLLYSNGTISTLINGDQSPADASFIRFGNFALGTTTAPERLTVEGNISSSGNISVTGTVDGRDLATDGSKLDGIEANADVTDAANVTSGLVAATGISAGNKTTIRTNLGVDAAGTDNSTDVTLAGSLDYITISGQEITRNAIDLSTDVTGQIATSSITNFPTEVSRSAAAAGFGAGGGGGSGTVTEVTVGTGLDITNGTTTPNVTLDLTEITLSSGLDSTTTGLSLDLTEVIADDTANRLLTTDGDGTLTAEAVSFAGGRMTFNPANSSGQFGLYHALTSGNNETSDAFPGEHLVIDTAITQQLGYVYNLNGTWAAAQADDVATSTGFLAIGCANNASSNRWMVRGIFNIASTDVTGTFTAGAPLYISDTNAGRYDFSPPSTSGDVSRIIGHAIRSYTSGRTTVYQCYFNPSPEWIEI